MRRSQYATWQMPQYVERFYGKPLRLSRLSDGRFEMRGANRTDVFEAVSVAHARDVVRSIACHALNIKDRRVLRWK